MTVRVLRASLVNAMRKRWHIESTNKWGVSVTHDPEELTITNERAGCRDCGCRLDVGVKALRVKRYSGFEGKNAGPSYVYIHAADCWEHGFVQTMTRDGIIGRMRYVYSVSAAEGGKIVYDADYTFASPKLMDDDLIEIADGNTPPSVSMVISNVVSTGISSHGQLAAQQAREARAKHEGERMAARERKHMSYYSQAELEGLRLAEYSVRHKTEDN